MLSYLPHYQRIDEEYIAKKIKEKQVDVPKYKNYLNTVNVIKGIDLMSSDGIDADLYSKLFNKYYTDKLTSILDEQIKDLFKPLFREYYLRFVNMTRDPVMDATILLNRDLELLFRLKILSMNFHIAQTQLKHHVTLCKTVVKKYHFRRFL